MTTRELLDGPITLSGAIARSSNILHSLRYPSLKSAFYARIENHRALLTEVIAHHLGVAPSAVDISSQKWWRHAQMGNSVGLAVTAAIAASVTERSPVRDPKTALMEGYRAAFWTIFASTVAVLVTSFLGLRTGGYVGKKND